MLQPPFRPATLAEALSTRSTEACCVAPAEAPPRVEIGGRARQFDLDSHLHCSVIGTCLSTAELRKLMARFIVVDGESDLEVHHAAVRLASQSAEVTRALHKALDRRHEAALARFAAARDEAALGALWKQALGDGAVPGAYWALLTHRRVTPPLRQRAFGDVYMLSHLVGAANRADIRRLVALVADNGSLRERLERQQERAALLSTERDDALRDAEALRRRIAELEAQATPPPGQAAATPPAQERLDALSTALALEAQRRQAALATATAARQELLRVDLEQRHLREQAAVLARELAAAEAQLLRRADGDDSGDTATLRTMLGGRRVLYVGGRPSSATAIRELVEGHGGECQRHDGGIEDRKGLLAAALAGADLVVFPVDCIDHDSALQLKRDCQRHGRPFIALRSASIASFVAGLLQRARAEPRAVAPVSGLCLRHA